MPRHETDQQYNQRRRAEEFWKRKDEAARKVSDEPITLETPPDEIVDPIEQLAMSLQWAEDYTDEYKCRVLADAIYFIVRRNGENTMVENKS